jgi:hypothetical protein
MNGLAFDTLAFARRLEAAGFTRKQSEVLAEEQAKIIDERLATKADLDVVRADLEKVRVAVQANIASLRLSTKADLAETKAAILRWVIGNLGGADRCDPWRGCRVR